MQANYFLISFLYMGYVQLSCLIPLTDEINSIIPFRLSYFAREYSQLPAIADTFFSSILEVEGEKNK